MDVEYLLLIPSNKRPTLPQLKIQEYGDLGTLKSRGLLIWSVGILEFGNIWRVFRPAEFGDFPSSGIPQCKMNIIILMNLIYLTNLMNLINLIREHECDCRFAVLSE